MKFFGEKIQFSELKTSLNAWNFRVKNEFERLEFFGEKRQNFRIKRL